MLFVIKQIRCLSVGKCILIGLRRIIVQLLDRRKALTITPFLRLGFRPFFLLGSVLAMLAIPLWIMALSGWFADWQPTGGWLAWHRHELLFGFAAAIIAGFLLTAVQTWTGIPGLSGRSLAILTGVWVAARLAWLVGAPVWLVVLLDVLFLPLVAAQMARSVWPVRQQRNYPLVIMLILMAIANAVTLYGVVTGNDQLQRQATVGGLWFVAGIMSMIGGRVIPFFTQRGLLRKEGVVAWPKLDWSLLIGTLLVSIALLQGWGMQPKFLLGIAFLALGIGQFIRVVRWYDAGIWHVPLLWSLHVAYAWMAVAYIVMAFWSFSILDNISIAVHALTVGAMGGLILAMIARVTLGHTGRALQPPRSMTWAFMLFNLGALARVFVVDWAYFPGLWIAAICWSLSFAMYVWNYAPMLWQARVDGNPG